MVRHAIGSMIITAAILAAPSFAATTPGGAAMGGDTPAAADHAAVPPASNPAANPAATSPAANSATNMNAGMPAGSSHAAAPATSAASQPAAPRYTTADDQVRLGKVVGATVYNDQNQSVGSIDDVLMGSDHKASTAVISVGGFLGMGGKLVSVPFDQLKIGQDKITMPGATKQSLSSMPAFKYNNA